MKPLVLASLLVGICISSIAQGEETLVSHDVTYRVGVAKASYLLVPQVSGKGAQTLALSPVDRLARCDDLVDAILGRAGVDRNKIQFVRDQTVALPGGKSWVIYSQRHQGYPIVGAGARLLLDANGQITQAGLNFEAKELPVFKPLGSARLRELAMRAVPYPGTREPVTTDLVIDPMGDAPARLLYYATFLVRPDGREQGWNVCIDAVSGEVLNSASAIKHLDSPSPQRVPAGGTSGSAGKSKVGVNQLRHPASPSEVVQPLLIDDGGGGGGGGGSGGSNPAYTVHIDIGDCVALEVDYTDEYGNINAANFTQSSYVSVEAGSSLTLRDSSAPTTCAKSATLNGSPISLPYGYAPSDGDDVNFSADCSPLVRSEEGSSPLCISPTLSTTQIFITDLPPGPTLSRPPINSIAQASAPNDYLSIPCQAVQVPPASLATLDNSRFDEVNAFYRANKFINEYLIPVGFQPYLGFDILTRAPSDLNQPGSGFDPATHILNLGQGDAYAWGAFGGIHYYDASKYSTVIDHEVTHVLFTWMFGPRFASPLQESQSVEEGIADFLAADYANNPAIGVCYVKDYDHLRTCDNAPQDFRYSLRSTCEYPVNSGFLANAGTIDAEGMIVSGLFWDIRKSLGPIAAEYILQGALSSGFTAAPNFAQLGAATLAAAQAFGYGCQVRALLVAREFPGIQPASAVTPTNLVVTTPYLADRCHVHATWSGTGSSYNVTWTPDGGVEQTLGSVTATVFDGSVGTAGGGTVNVYSVYCGQTSSPASARREAVTANAASTGIQATNQPDGQGGTQTLVSWNAVPNALNYQVTRSGVPIGGVLPANQTSYIDPAGCAGTFSYCVNVVDCAGPQTGGPCVTDTRPGSPLAVTVTGPTSLHANTAGTFTAHVTGGCGISRVTWWWMMECLNKSLAINIPECNVWYAVQTDPPGTTFTRGFANTNYADVKAEVVDLNGTDVTSAPFQVQIITPAPGLVAGGGQTEASSQRQEGPPKLVCDGRTIALANSGSAGSGLVTLQLFDVAGRRVAQMTAPTGESSRLEFAAGPELSRGVYFARATLPNGAVLRQMVVLRKW